ncbi:MAG: 50S ribosomal protein L30 [Clostridiales bacterium]|jgi:large subunit ribosomal protein L30|nr:50S ribosomal protein L30 [Clostridiales bacterium]
MAEKVKITLVRSTIGANAKHKKIVEALGLRKLNRSIVVPNNDATKGVIAQISHLVKVEEI